jgi:aspartate carbamoyltransferase catalytic subunit
MTRHLLSLKDLSSQQITGILDRASELRAAVAAGQRRFDHLSGRNVALVFMEPSTRTRFSFERATERLGAESLAFTPANSSTKKGESLRDTAITLQAVGADAIVLRHRYGGAARRLSRWLDIPIVNAGDGINEHPTQALLDALTLRDRLGDLQGKTLGIVGDVRHSRVARSNSFGLPKLGMKVLMSGPGSLCPPEMASLGVEVCSTIDEVLERVDAVMVLRVQRERIGPSMIPSEKEYRRVFGLTSSRLARHPKLVVMHPGPMNRGVEIDDAVADAPQSTFREQMHNGVYVRMATLMEVMA